MTDKQLNAKIVATTVDNASAGLQKIKKNVDSLSESEKKADAQEQKNVKTKKEDTIATEALKNETIKYKSVVYELTKTHTSSVTSTNKITNAKTKLTSVTKNYRDEAGNTRSIVDKTTKSVNNGANAWGFASVKIDAAMQAMNRVRWAMVNVTFALAGIAALVSPFVLLTKYGMDWETQIRKIQVVTDGAYAGLKGYIELAETIKDIRAEGPFSSSDVSSAFFEFSKAGFSGEEAKAALPAIQKLATIGFTDLETATDIAVQTLHEFSLQGITAEQVVNTIAMAANRSAMDVETFGAAMAYVGPIAANVGISMEESAAAIALLSNAGLKGSKAGTALRQTLNAIANPSEEAKKRMNELGISFYDAEGNIKSLSEIFTTLEASISHMSDAGKQEVLGDIFSIRSRVAVAAFLNVLKEGGAGIAEFRTDLETDMTYSAKKMEEAMDTSSNQIKKFVNTIKEEFETAGRELNTYFGHIAESANDMTEFFENMKKSEVSKAIDDMTNSYDDYIDRLIEAGGKQKELAATIKSLENAFQTFFASLLGPFSMFYQQIKNSNEIMELFGKKSEEIAKKDGIAKVFENPDAVSKYSTEIDRATQAMLVNEQQQENFFGRLQDFFDSANMKESSTAVKHVTSILEQLNEVQEANTGASENMINSMGALETQLTTIIADIISAETELEKETNLMNDAEDAVNNWKDDISDAKKELTEWNTSLKEVNDSIKVLSSARFTGQTDVEKLISDVERYNKEQTLAAYGIGDAYSWLQQQVAISATGFDNLTTSIEKVNSATDTSTDSYEAWRETVQEFIRDSVKSGNDLSKNVTGAVSSYQTLLMSTDRFSDSTTDQSNYISLLKDAYDVYYGGMQDDVKNSIQLHEDEKNGVYDSSSTVISALHDQWLAQSTYEDAVSETEKAISDLNDELDASTAAFEIYGKNVDTITKKIEKLKDTTDEVDILVGIAEKEKAKEKNTGSGMTDAELMETDYYKAIVEKQKDAAEREALRNIDFFGVNEMITGQNLFNSASIPGLSLSSVGLNSLPEVATTSQFDINSLQSSNENKNSLFVDVKIAADMISDQINDAITNLLYKDGVKY